MDIQQKYDNSDSNVRATIDELLDRADKGKVKYGTTLDGQDLIDIQYLIELKQELCDGVIY